jgi:RNA polymerase sigma factor (sigma-70 family)
MYGAEQLSDDVVRAAAEGVRPDVERVLGVLQPQVHAMVAARLSVNPARLDIVEETGQAAMIAVADALSRLENRTVAGLRSLVSVIVSRRVADSLRQKGRARLGGRPVASLDTTIASMSEVGPLWSFLSASGPSPLSALRKADQVSLVLHELGQLKPEHREIIAFALFDQLPTREIAHRLGVSRRAASMLLLRAIRALRERVIDASQTRGPHGGPI